MTVTELLSGRGPGDAQRVACPGTMIYPPGPDPASPARRIAQYASERAVSWDEAAIAARANAKAGRLTTQEEYEQVCRLLEEHAGMKADAARLTREECEEVIRIATDQKVSFGRAVEILKAGGDKPAEYQRSELPMENETTRAEADAAVKYASKHGLTYEKAIAAVKRGARVETYQWEGERMHQYGASPAEIQAVTAAVTPALDVTGLLAMPVADLEAMDHLKIIEALEEEGLVLDHHERVSLDFKLATANGTQRYRLVREMKNRGRVTNAPKGTK